MSINIAHYIDHTLLKSDASTRDIARLCQEAIDYQFYAVCVNSCHTALAHSLLKDSSVKIAVTIGFPLGAMSTSAKVAEASQAVQDGAHEIDMVCNIGWVKSQEYRKVVEDMQAVKKGGGNNIVKVIFENGLLSLEEKHRLCTLAIESGVDYIKTSTGFTTGSQPSQGAVKEDLILMLEAVKNTEIKVKAAGGVRDARTALEYIAMGVSRIGTSSGITLVSPEASSSEKTEGY